MGIESVDEDLTVQERSAMKVARAIMDPQRSMISALKSRSKVVEKDAKILRS